MGIGRFAFTPMLPLMQRDGGLDIAGGAWLAAANYGGYFAGALGAVYLRVPPQHLIRGSLLPIALATAAMGLTAHLVPWLAWRFVAGVLSAWVLVGTSTWCLGQLAQAGKPALAGVVYAGVGAGIALAGLLCLALGKTAASRLWIELGGIAAVLTLVVWFLMLRSGAGQTAVSAQQQVAATETGARQRGLIVCYGTLGFGYILPATFIPALGRMVVDDPALFGWAWPIFGATAALSTVLAGFWFSKMPRMLLLSRCYFVMAAGAGLPAVHSSLPALIVSAVCVGSTFMIITMGGLQEARARAGANPARLMGQMTAAFAIGQIAGPVFTALLSHAPAIDDMKSLRAGLIAAAISLATAGLWLRRAAPIPTSPATAPGEQS